MATVRQESFSAGELSPTLHARTGLPQYAAGARRMLNLFVTPQGAALNRPGMERCAGPAVPATGRLIPFLSGAGGAWVLLFTSQYVRFYRAGSARGAGDVATDQSHGIATPYAEEHLAELQYAQLGDVLFLAHPAYPPARLSLSAGFVWAHEYLDFSVPEPTFPGTPALRIPPAEDETHVAKEWQYAVTTVALNNAGLLIETRPYVVTQTYYWDLNGPVAFRVFSDAPATLVVYPDRPIVLNWSAGTSDEDIGVPGDGSLRTLSYRVYRGRGGLFGFIGETKRTGFTDYGQEPDYAQPPPGGINRFEVRGPDGESLLEYDNPAAVAFFEQRLVFAGSYRVPGGVWASRTGDYLNFDIHRPSTEDESLFFELASRRYEYVRSLVGVDRLLAFTDSSVWSISGGDAGLSGFNARTQVQAEIGAASLPPILMTDGALFVGAQGVSVHEMAFSAERAKYTGSNLTLLAQHLFGRLHLVDWAHAREPFGLVWAVRSDGALLCLTRIPEQQVTAWTECRTEGVVKSVCVIPEDGRDVLYLLVDRGALGVHVERLADRIPPSTTQVAEDDDSHRHDFGNFLDCSTLYPAHGTPGSELTVASVFLYATRFAGRTVTAVNGGHVYEGLPVDAQGRLYYPDGWDRFQVSYVGLPYTCDFETLDVAGGADARGRQKNVTGIAFEVELSRGLKVGPSFERLTEWRERTATVGGAPLPLRTESVRVQVGGGWERAGRACLRHEAPMPLTLLAVSREVELGER